MLGRGAIFSLFGCGSKMQDSLFTYENLCGLKPVRMKMPLLSCGPLSQKWYHVIVKRADFKTNKKNKLSTKTASPKAPISLRGCTALLMNCCPSEHPHGT